MNPTTYVVQAQDTQTGEWYDVTHETSDFTFAHNSLKEEREKWPLVSHQLVRRDTIEQVLGR